MKKQWQKPELIVLVRSKPEEAVLTACKGGANLSGIDRAKGACIDKIRKDCFDSCYTVGIS